MQNKQDKRTEKFHEMLEAPVDRLILKLAIPSILSMLTTSFYNMADTFFVSKLDTSSTAAVGVTFASMSIIQALGFFFGQGSGTYMARELGAQRIQNARTMASTSFFYAFICGLFLLLIGHFNARDIAQLTGSTPTILPHAASYLAIIMCGAPVMMCSLLMNNHLRFQGNSAFGMVGIMAGGVLNMLLDPLFIFFFGLGVSGAAYATVISQCFSFFILLVMTHKGGNIPIRFRDFHPSAALFKEITAGGLPSLFRQGTASLATISLNVAAGAFGDAAIAAMSIVTRLAFIGASAIIGIGQGFQPVCGFSYGARSYQRLRDGFAFSLRLNTAEYSGWTYGKPCRLFLCRSHPPFVPRRSPRHFHRDSGAPGPMRYIYHTGSRNHCQYAFAGHKTHNWGCPYFHRTDRAFPDSFCSHCASHLWPYGVDLVPIPIRFMCFLSILVPDTEIFPIPSP